MRNTKKKTMKKNEIWRYNVLEGQKQYIYTFTDIYKTINITYSITLNIVLRKLFVEN